MNHLNAGNKGKEHLLDPPSRTNCFRPVHGFAVKAPSLNARARKVVEEEHLKPTGKEHESADAFFRDLGI